MNYKIYLVATLLTALSACNKTEETYMVGTLERDRVEVSVESDEPIIAIHVQDGQMLDTGDLILEQDPARSETILAHQTALMNQSAARLTELERGPRQETIREARALLSSTKASTVNSLENMKRAKEMFARDLSNQSTLDFASTRWKTAVAAEQAAGESLDRLLNGTTLEELQQAMAAYDAAQARVSQVELDIIRLKIYAPVNGMLDKRLYQLGERPQRSATVAVILDSARTFARIYVPEPFRSSVQPGMQLDVRIDGESRSVKGTVRWVSADATFTPYFALTEHDRSRLSYLAEVDVPDASSLPSGVPLEVDFPVSNTAAN
jgi:HlyD family secretion protein